MHQTPVQGASGPRHRQGQGQGWSVPSSARAGPGPGSAWGQGRGCQAAPCQHQLRVFAVGSISAMLASWDTGLCCLVAVSQDTGWCAGLLGAEGWLPWHTGTGPGRSWAAGAALSPRGPPAAPRLPNFAAEPGQLLPPCPRSAALLSPATGLSSQLLLLGLRLTPRNAKSPLPQDPAGSVPPGLRSGRACLCAAQPRAHGHSHGTAGGMWGALPGPVRCAMSSSRVCQNLWARLAMGQGQRAPAWRFPPRRLWEKRQRTQPAFTSVIFLILFTSKMTKTKPSAPGPSPCPRRRAGGLWAPRPCVLPLPGAGHRQGCRQGTPARRAGCSAPAAGRGDPARLR